MESIPKHKTRIDINVINAHDLSKVCKNVEDELKITIILQGKKYTISSIYESYDTDQLQLHIAQKW